MGPARVVYLRDFFFQAEDGIRDRNVTGVQTCALPISVSPPTTQSALRNRAINGTLGALMALLRNALCVVGGDTGPLHLAVALGTPVVALFGPTDPARNGPYRPGARSAKDLVLRSRNAVTTYKRGDQPDASLLDLPVA